MISTSHRKVHDALRTCTICKFFSCCGSVGVSINHRTEYWACSENKYLSPFHKEFISAKLKYCKNSFALMLALMIQQGHQFIHVTRTLLSWHVQNYELLGTLHDSSINSLWIFRITSLSTKCKMGHQYTFNKHVKSYYIWMIHCNGTNFFGTKCYNRKRKDCGYIKWEYWSPM